MSMVMDEDVKRWTARRKSALVLKIIQGKPEVIRLDSHPEMTVQSIIESAEGQNILLRFMQPGKPTQNAFIERFNKSYRHEVLDTNLFNTLA